MEAEGQLTDFGSEDEGKAMASKSFSKSTQTDSDDEKEVFFNKQVNNNANITTADMDPPINETPEELEEGECSQRSSRDEDRSERDRHPSRTEEEDRGLELIDQWINSSLEQFQTYVDQKLDNVARVAELERLLADNKRQLQELKVKGIDEGDSQSELTIYKNAVEKKRESSSSEEGEGLIDTSDEYFENAVVEKQMHSGQATQLDDCQPSTSRGPDPSSTRKENVRVVMEKSVPEQRAEQLRQESAVGRAHVYDVKGREIDLGLSQIRLQQGNELGMVPPVLPPNIRTVDDQYMLVASHVEESVRTKIINGEYVDFTKLLRCDKSGGSDEDQQQKMMMVNKGGLSYWIPVMDKSSAITGYHRWDQAFRVFLDIYTNRFPERTSELIQYGHIIQTAAQSYMWDNVYMYDREFGRHMERFPDRSWGVILQQAWTMFLKDRAGSSTPGHRQSYGANGNGAGPSTLEQKPPVVCKLCFPFNRGNCKFGAKCKFDHRCGLCGKYDHGVHNC